MVKIDKIRKYMIVGLTVLSFAAVTACGAKKDTAAGNIEQSTESATVAKAKDIQMQVKDAGDKQETNNAGQNENTSDVPGTKPSGESNSANTEETSTPDNKPDNGNNSNTSDTTPATPTVPEHTHTWSPVTTRIHHNATGHYEDVVVETKTVVDKAAWNEPVYEYRAYAVKCLGCGKEFENGLDYQEHSMNRIDEGYDECGRSTVLYRNEQVDTIHHEEETHEETVTEKRWVEDTAEYDETVISYICSCGATK